MASKPVIGITMGDPAGIGPEICAKAIASGKIRKVASCMVIGDRRFIRQGLKISGLEGIEINSIKKVTEAKFLPRTIEVLDLHNADPAKIKIGRVSHAAGKAAMEYLEKAILSPRPKRSTPSPPPRSIRKRSS